MFNPQMMGLISQMAGALQGRQQQNRASNLANLGAPGQQPVDQNQAAAQAYMNERNRYSAQRGAKLGGMRPVAGANQGSAPQMGMGAMQSLGAGSYPGAGMRMGYPGMGMGGMGGLAQLLGMLGGGMQGMGQGQLQNRQAMNFMGPSGAGMQFGRGMGMPPAFLMGALQNFGGMR